MTAILKENKLYYCFDGSKYVTVTNIKEIKDGIVTCNQLIVTRNQQFDIAVIEKMIFFCGPKNIKRLYEKYTHKTLDVSSVQLVLKAMLVVYTKQNVFVSKYKLQDAVNFHAKLAGYLGYINAAEPIRIKEKAILAKNNMLGGIGQHKILGKRELIDYMTSKRYDFYDITVGKFKFDHEFLLSLKDDVLNQHVEGEKYRAIAISNQIEPTMPINHNVFGAITGRIQTSKPNIQSINPSDIEGNVYSFDYTGFELVIYLQLYNKVLLEQFKHDGKKDIFAYIIFKIYPKLYDFDSDDLKERDPLNRDKFKKFVIRTLYGASENDVSYWYGEKIVPLYKAVLKILNIRAAKEELMNYLTRSGRYLINKKYSLSVQDRYSSELISLDVDKGQISNRITPEFGKYIQDKKIYDSLPTAKRGYIISYLENYNKCLKLCLNYHIQGTGAFILKHAMYNAISSKMSSQVLILRHDEIIVDIKDDNDIEKIKKAMRQAALQVIGTEIDIHVTKK